MHKALGRALAAAALFALATPAAAQTKQASGYSAYERASIEKVAATLHAEIDRHPQGKIIESVDIYPLEVIEERDPVPHFLAGILNSLHATSRKYVIQREVLQRVGDPYDQELADEATRNLAGLRQLSLVVVAPFTGSAPDRVRLVVITKDVWSLRMGFDIGVGPGGLERLLLEPTESNLAGTQQTVLGRFTYRPESYSLGASYVIPRLDGLYVRFVSDANIIINGRRGTPEGSYGTASVYKPLFSSHEEWNWGVTVAWRDEVLRRYVNAQLATFDAKATAQKDGIPYEYRGRRFTDTAAVTRSFGRDVKNDFTFGAEVNRRAYLTDDLSGFDPRAAEAFVHQVMPVSDTRIGPFVQWRGYTNEFLRVRDFETLGLQEDYRLGHDLWLRFYPVSRGLGSSRNFVGTYAAAQYTLPLGDGLVRGLVDTTTEAEEEKLSDASIEGDLRLVTPRFFLGRLIFDAAAFNRYRNYLNSQSLLGGDTRLRGYPSSYLSGKDLVAMNVELRSRPVEILACQLGLAAFYDVGDAFDGYDHLEPLQGAGAGFRVLFPQVDRIVFRGDFGVPLARPLPAGVGAYSFFFTFEQAFVMPSIGTTATQGAPSTTGALGQ